jgi:hypothetical protein
MYVTVPYNEVSFSNMYFFKPVNCKLLSELSTYFNETEVDFGITHAF